MIDLLIDRLHARAEVTDPEQEQRVRALLADLTRSRLDEALGGVAVPGGDWCLRRLEVGLDLDPAGADSAVGRRWAHSITDALAEAIAHPGTADVVHYPHRGDAVVDLVAALATGDRRREWAWRAVGALGPGDPDPGSSPAAAAVAALAGHPGTAVHLLATAVERAGLPAAHRLLGDAGWRSVAATALAAAGGPRIPWLDTLPDDSEPDDSEPDDSEPDDSEPDDAVGDAGPGRAGDDVVDDGAPGDAAAGGTRRAGPGRAASTAGRAAARALAGDVLDRSRIARAWRAGSLRPEAATARAWALLAVLEVEPSLLRRPRAAGVLAGVRAEASAGSGDQTLGPRPAAMSGARAPGAPRSGAAPTTARPVVEARSTRPPAGASRIGAGAPSGSIRPPAVSAPEPEAEVAPALRAEGSHPIGGPVGGPTSCGGLVHLLATAPAAGIPDRLLDESPLADRPFSWTLYHLLRRLCPDPTSPRTATDPALLALSRLGEPPTAVPTPEQEALLDAYAAGWAAATLDRMGAAEDPDPQAALTRLVTRDGYVDAVPGWVELRLRLADVDLAVRRAGLDLDPGYVPWLGVVVVIHYE